MTNVLVALWLGIGIGTVVGFLLFRAARAAPQE